MNPKYHHNSLKKLENVLVNGHHEYFRYSSPETVSSFVYQKQL